MANGKQFQLSDNAAENYEQISARYILGPWAHVLVSASELKTGARLVRHARYAVFQFAKAALPRQIFAGLLARINGLRAPPAKAACA